MVKRTDVELAAVELDQFLLELRHRHHLSAEQLYDVLSFQALERFKDIDRGLTINCSDTGKLVEVLKAMLGLQEGPDCWNKEYATRLLQILHGKGVEDGASP